MVFHSLFYLVCLLSPGAGEQTVRVEYDFETPESIAEVAVTSIGEEAKRFKPKIADGQLYLLESWWKLVASAGFPAPTTEACDTVMLSFKLIMNTGTEGAGFLWLDQASHGTSGEAPEVKQWEAPNLAGCFGVGFDASNPVNRDPFRGSGNVYDRPQHEVSLHWDGREIVKKTTPVDFRDGEPHAVRLKIRFEVGGASISLSLDGDPILYDFIPSMTAYAGRPAFGGRNSEIAGDVLLDDLSVFCEWSRPELEPPLSIIAIDHQLNDAKNPKNEALVDFPENTDEYGRIICTLSLDKPETRFDPWDRTASIAVFDENGERFELIRYITPYHRGHLWKVDVTDFRPLLRGKRRIEQACTTYGEGWVVTVTFDFYPGPADRKAYKVINLWSGAPEVGNPDKPPEDFYIPKEIALDPETAHAKVRTVVTGHGMSPNTNNAAEFMPLGRTLTINGETFYNLLWKEDNYLNPCRPQGGTWKYDRAGWAPGDVVRPWEVWAPQLTDENRKLKIEYRLDPYLNEARGETWAPTHQTEAHLVLYRKEPEIEIDAENIDRLHDIAPVDRLH